MARIPESPEACWPRSLLALRSVEVSWGWRVVSRWSSKVLRNRTVHTSAADVVASKTVCWVGALVVFWGRRPCGAGEERRCDTLHSVKGALRTSTQREASRSGQHRRKTGRGCSVLALCSSERARLWGGALPIVGSVPVRLCGSLPVWSLGRCPMGSVVVGLVGRCPTSEILLSKPLFKKYQGRSQFERNGGWVGAREVLGSTPRWVCALGQK